MLTQVREDWLTDLGFALGAVVTTYAGTTMQKAITRPVYAVASEAGAGVAALVVRHYTGRHTFTHELLEGVAGAGIGASGTFLAANTTTLGNKPAADPGWQLNAGATSGGAGARAAAVRAAAAARARAAAAARGTPGGGGGGGGARVGAVELAEDI